MIITTRRAAALAAAAATLALGACGSSNDTSSTATPAGTAAAASGTAPAATTTTKPTGAAFKVGIICSCSGAQASQLGGIDDVYQSWADSVNAAGGIDGHPVDVTVGTTPATRPRGLRPPRSSSPRRHGGARQGGGEEQARGPVLRRVADLQAAHPAGAGGGEAHRARLRLDGRLRDRDELRGPVPEDEEQRRRRLLVAANFTIVQRGVAGCTQQGYTPGQFNQGNTAAPAWRRPAST